MGMAGTTVQTGNVTRRGLMRGTAATAAGAAATALLAACGAAGGSGSGADALSASSAPVPIRWAAEVGTPTVDAFNVDNMTRKDWKQADIDDFYKTQYEAFKIEGKQLGIPVYANVNIMFVNR